MAKNIEVGDQSNFGDLSKSEMFVQSKENPFPPVFVKTQENENESVNLDNGNVKEFSESDSVYEVII